MRFGSKLGQKSHRNFFTGSIRPQQGTRDPLAVTRRRAWTAEGGFHSDATRNWNRQPRLATASRK